MNIKILDSIPKFKNSEDFTNRVIQEILVICKNNSDLFTFNEQINKLKSKMEELSLKNKKLDELLEKSNSMKYQVTNKTNLLVETNNNFRNKLLQRINK